jgi:hypothetical protein
MGVVVPAMSVGTAAQIAGTVRKRVNKRSSTVTQIQPASRRRQATSSPAWSRVSWWRRTASGAGLRYAVLLAPDDESPDILARAEHQRADRDQSLRSRGIEPRHDDDQDTYPPGPVPPAVPKPYRHHTPPSAPIALGTTTRAG